MLFGTYNIPHFAMKNRAEVASSTSVGCYHCCEIFEPSKIVEYTDEGQTCVCPFCHVDAVIGNMGLPDEVTVEKLKKAQLYWFNTKAQNSRPSP